MFKQGERRWCGKARTLQGSQEKKRRKEGTFSFQNRLEESKLLLVLTCISIRHFGCVIPMSNSFAFILFWIWRDWTKSAAVPSSLNYHSELNLVRNGSDSAAFETDHTVEEKKNVTLLSFLEYKHVALKEKSQYAWMASSGTPSFGSTQNSPRKT